MSSPKPRITIMKVEATITRAPNKRGVLRILQRHFVLFLNENIRFDSSEPSRSDSSNDGSQNMFVPRNKDDFPKLSQLSFLI